MIIVLGSRKQYEVDAVCSKLEKVTEILVVDYLVPHDVILSIDVDSQGHAVPALNGIPLDRSVTIWAAVRFYTSKFGDTQDWAEEVIASEQWRAFYRNIQYAAPGRTLNGFDAICIGANKFVQLCRANDVGFSIPASLVSNSTNKLRSFVDVTRSSITKALGDPHYPVIEGGVEQRAIMTATVSADMLDPAVSHEPFPTFLQNNIEKRFELRIIVVGSQIVAFRIDPFQHAIMNTDYRRGGMMVDYQRIDLDELITTKVRQLHKELGIFSASYDFIVGVDGVLTFLEVNPFGVWGYMDNLTKGSVSSMVSDEILKFANVEMPVGAI